MSDNDEFIKAADEYIDKILGGEWEYQKDGLYFGYKEARSFVFNIFAAGAQWERKRNQYSNSSEQKER